MLIRMWAQVSWQSQQKRRNQISEPLWKQDCTDEAPAQIMLGHSGSRNSSYSNRFLDKDCFNIHCWGLAGYDLRFFNPLFWRKNIGAGTDQKTHRCINACAVQKSRNEMLHMQKMVSKQCNSSTQERQSHASLNTASPYQKQRLYDAPRNTQLSAR